MNVLYTIGHSRLFKETIGNDAEHHFKGFRIDNVCVNGEKMSVFFCRNETGIFAIAGKSRKGNAYRSCGHWHSGKLYFDIYYRKKFQSAAEGNDFYKKTKSTMTI